MIHVHLVAVVVHELVEGIAVCHPIFLKILGMRKRKLVCPLMVFSADVYRGGVDKVDRTLCIYIHMLPTALVLTCGLGLCH